MAEGGQMPFPGRDLEEENKALRAEIERLRKVLTSNGLTSASALTHRHNSDLRGVFLVRDSGPASRLFCGIPAGARRGT